MTDRATNCSHTTRHFSSTLGSLEQALSGKKGQIITHCVVLML